MTAREFIHKTMMEYPDLKAIHGGRVVQGGSLTTATLQKPYLVHHFGNDTDEQLSEDSDVVQQPHRQYFQVYIHDEIGDYTQIDNLNKLLKKCFRDSSSAPDQVMQIRYLETSQDLRDEVLGTIFRYARFQVIMS